MLVGPSNQQLGLLAVFLDLARSVSQCVADISIVIYGGTCRRGDVVSVERGCWFEGDGFAILLQLRRWEAAGSWFKMTWGRLSVDVPQRHVSRCVHQACSWPTKPCWQWCFFESCNGGGSASFLALVSATLELDGCRWLRWLQATLGISVYFLIS
jgi:hypothetical protein